MKASDRNILSDPGILKYREEMGITKEWAFLDTACVAPISNRASEELISFAGEMASSGPANQEQWIVRIDRTRVLASRLLNCDADEVAFVKNTSEGISFVANGFPFEPGDEVVIAGIEFPANRYAWHELEKKGVSVKTVQSDDGRVPTESIISAVTEKTKLVSVSSVQFSSGYRQDLKAIGEFCRSKGVFFFVDMIQSLGALRMDVREFKIDAASADGHKWLVSPEGIGVFYISKGAQKVIRPTEIGWFNFADPLDFLAKDKALKDDATRYESGTPNTLGIFALNASMSLLMEIGIERIEEYVLELSDYLCEKLQGKGYTIYSSRAEGEKSPIVVFESAEIDPDKVNEDLNGRKIKATSRFGRLRAAVHFFNNTDDVDRLVEALPEVRR